MFIGNRKRLKKLLHIHKGSLRGVWRSLRESSQWEEKRAWRIRGVPFIDTKYIVSIYRNYSPFNYIEGLSVFDSRFEEGNIRLEEVTRKGPKGNSVGKVGVWIFFVSFPYFLDNASTKVCCLFPLGHSCFLYLHFSDIMLSPLKF